MCVRERESLVPGREGGSERERERERDRESDSERVGKGERE